MCNYILEKKYYWEGYTSDIIPFLSKCAICSADKIKNPIKPEMKIISDEGPKYRYIVDTWNLPDDLSTNTEYLYGLDVIDHFSKFYHCYLLRNKGANLVLSKIILFINENGKCKILQSDRGTEFNNNIMKIYCENNDIKHIISSPYHLQTNGSIEIMHKQCKEYLYKLKIERKKNFDLEIGISEFIVYHNNKKHSITGYKPVEIRDSENEDLIKRVLSNIIKSLQRKIKKNDNAIFKGAFLLISTKFYKKGNLLN